MEIEQRLGLYQVFLKLYEHHRTLLNEILQLEKTGNKTFYRGGGRFITGVIQEGQAHIITNLVDGKTQTLIQSQGIWSIGRDRQLSIAIPDRRLSRRHAAIQYVPNQGFYLVDLDSTNGSFVNGEPAHGRFFLRDGDSIRLSSIAFSFFLCRDVRVVADTPPEILEQLEAATTIPTLATAQQLSELTSADLEATQVESSEHRETSRFLQDTVKLRNSDAESSAPPLSPAQRSEILDRFFSRQIQKTGKQQ